MTTLVIKFPHEYEIPDDCWDFLPISDVCFYQEGPGLRNWQWTYDGMKVINITNILGDGSVYTHNTDKYISLDEFERRYKHFKVDEGDIVIASSGWSYGKVGRIIDSNLPLMMNTSVIRFRSKNKKLLDNNYLFAFLRSSFMKTQIDILITGVDKPNFGPSHIKRMSIPLPPLPTQQKIASILSAYDDLIENNLKRIKLLEETAQNIYKEWFVHFRFPGFENARFGDDACPPERRGLPEGWEKIKIIELCDISGGGTPSTNNPEYWEAGDIYWFSPTDLSKNSSLVLTDSEKKITELGLNKSSAKLLPPRTILMSSRATIGLFGLISHPCSTNQGFINMIPFEDYYLYYLLFNLKNRKEEIIGKASGATFKEISKRVFKELEVVKPDLELLEFFNNLSESIINQIENLEFQNQTLKEARDILLLRLMDRRIEV